MLSLHESARAPVASRRGRSVGTTLDSEVLGDLFGTDEARSALGDRALLQGWLDAERALALAEAEVGVIPAAAAERIAAEADAWLFDPGAIRQGIGESQHPLVPFLRALVARCGDAGGYVHWGATTQDVMDTGAVLQIRSALVPIERDLRRATTAAAELARRHASTVIAGRTHGQHAVPTTFGLEGRIVGRRAGPRRGAPRPGRGAAVADGTARRRGGHARVAR